MTHLSKSKTKQKHSFLFEMFGTGWSIDTPEKISAELEGDILHRLNVYDQTYSRFSDDSQTSRLSNPGTYEFPDDFKKLFEVYETCYRLTEGRMTPLIGGMLEDAGYDKSYSLKAKDIRSVPKLQEAIKWDGKNMITSLEPVVFDVGAAGKGHAVDLIAELLEQHGIRDYVIDASGDMRHRGDTSERVGLEDPSDPTKVIGIVDVYNQSLCASASNRRKWQNFHHIMDPESFRSVDYVVATWVIADETIVADAVATALFFIDSTKELEKVFPCSYVRMFADGTVDYSASFRGQLFT